MSASTPAARPAGTTTARQPHQYLALVIGIVYLVVGLAGFLVTGVDGFTEHDHAQTLAGFAINPLHNIVHIVIGLLGIALWSTASRARTYGWLLFVGYGATFVYGLVVANNPDANILNINGADNGLHLVSALAGLAIARGPRRDRDRTTSTTVRT
jgi:ABC-type transport system involved in multi-copper enzyme maturation permease subunit